MDPKTELRQQCLRRRAAIELETRNAAAEILARRGLGWLEDVSALHTIGGYMAVRKELDINGMMLNLMEIGHGIGLPVTPDRGQPLIFRKWDGTPDLPKTKFGVPTPPVEQPEVEPDTVLVPMLAFDAEGYRLGYGGGFYDVTLNRLRSKRTIVAVGIAFDEQELPRVPREPHDARLDWVLTQSGPRKVGD